MNDIKNKDNESLVTQNKIKDILYKHNTLNLKSEAAINMLSLELLKLILPTEANVLQKLRDERDILLERVNHINEMLHVPDRPDPDDPIHLKNYYGRRVVPHRGYATAAALLLAAIFAEGD